MSRFLRWSCCALTCSLVLALSSAECNAQAEQVALHNGPRQHQPVYDYVPADGSNVQGLGYWGPVNCGANCSCNCGGDGDESSGGGDCGCGGCDGSCGCGPTCNCGSGGGCGDCGGGFCGGGCSSGGGGCGSCGMGCGSCDMGCGSCEMGCDPCDCDYDCCPKLCIPRFTMYGEFLYLQVTNADVAYAQQQDGLGGAGTVPFGEIATIGQDFNPGFRVGGSIACGCSSEVGVSFTHFESDSFDSVEAPFNTNTGAVGSLVQHPGAALTASSGPVDATYDVDFQLGDVMWRKVFLQDPRYNMAFSAGVEYGHLKQKFSSDGFFGGGSGGEIDTSTGIKFDGAGIKVGFDGDHQFAHGLGIYGRLTAAALTGRFKSHYAMFNNTTDQMLAQADWTDDRVIGQIEYEVGASITSCDRHWRAAAGYMFSYWTNTVTTSDFIDAVQADNYTDVGSTIGFNGLVGRVECLW